MSTNDRKSGSPVLTLTTESELEETTTREGDDAQEKKVSQSSANSLLETLKPLSFLAESQRLQHEMLRVELV